MKTIATLPSSNKMWPYSKRRWGRCSHAFSHYFPFLAHASKIQMQIILRDSPQYRHAVKHKYQHAVVRLCSMNLKIWKHSISWHIESLGGALIIWVPIYFIFLRAREEVSCESLNRWRYFVGFILIPNIFFSFFSFARLIRNVPSASA